MHEHRPVRWTRLDGTSVPIERLDLHELVAAHQQLLSGSWDAEDTRLLVAAIEKELELRWRRNRPRPDAAADDEVDDSHRAA